MNSFQDLNNYGAQTVTYTDNSGYVLTLGPFAGNANIVANVSVTHSLLNRQPISQFTNSILPLDVIVTSPADNEGVPITAVDYVGNNSNLTITQTNTVQWTIGNAWTISDYNEIFANTLVTINPLRQNDFTYSTTLSDQQGNGKVWYTTVDVIPFGFSRPSSVVYNEDSNTVIDGMSITDISNQDYTFTFDLVPAAAGNLKLNANAFVSNTFTLSGNRNVINSFLTANVTYLPFFDYSSNSNITINAYNNTTNVSLGTSNIALIIGATHADFTAPTEIVRAQANSNVGTNTGSANLRVTDLAQGCQYTSNVSLITTTIGNLWIGSTNYGSNITLTGTSTQVNGNLANIVLVSNTSTQANGNIRYTQINVTAGNLSQANVVIPVVYQPTSVHVRSGIEKPIGTRIGSLYTTGSDFWAYEWQVNASYSPSFPGNGFINWYQDRSIGASSGNVNLADFRQSNIVRFPSTSIAISAYKGITSAYDTGMNGLVTGQVFSFWVYPVYAQGDYCFAGIMTSNLSSGNNGSDVYGPSPGNIQGWFFHYTNGSVQINRSMPLVQRNPAPFNPWYVGPRVALGAIAQNQWTNITFQKTSGYRRSSTYSVWVNGQPRLSFYGPGSSSNPNGTAATGSTWFNSTDGFSNVDDSWYKFVFGAPMQPNEVAWTTTVGFGYWNNATNPISNMLMYIDDITLANNAPYTNNVSFTPTLQTYGGNVRQLWSGI